jgi:hypothetical protein
MLMVYISVGTLIPASLRDMLAKLNIFLQWGQSHILDPNHKFLHCLLGKQELKTSQFIG